MTTTFVSDSRAILNEADATTGWTGSSSVSTGTTDPSPIESTNWLAMAVGTSTDDAYVSITSDDYSLGGTLFVWMQANGAMDTVANGGIAVQVGDGTNRIGYHTGGSDQSAFRHEAGPVRWECHVIDLASKPANNTAYAGSEASLDETAITQVGVGFKTLSKALGGANNCFWDIIRFADPGEGVVLVGGTTSGAAGNGSEAAVVDRGTAHQAAYGIIREIGAGLYSLQGNMILGDSASASDQFWAETNATYAWEDRGLSDRNYYRFALIGSSTATNCEFSFTATTFTVPSATNASFDGNGADITVCNMLGCTFINFNGGVRTSDDTGDLWTGCSFIGNGSVEANGCDLTGSSFSDTVECALTEAQDETSYDDTATEGYFAAGSGYAATDTITLSEGQLITVDTVSSGAVTEFTVTTSEGFIANINETLTQSSTSGSGTGFELTPRSANLTEGGSIFYDLAVDPDGELDNCTFTKGTPDTHAIVFGPNIPTPITVRGCDFTGYSNLDENAASVFHFLDTSGTITLNVVACTTDGSGFTTKSEGATINVVADPVTVAVHVDDNTGAALQNARVLVQAADGTGIYPFEESVTIARSGSTATVTHASHGMQNNDYVVIKGANEFEYNGIHQISNVAAGAYDYTVTTRTNNFQRSEEFDNAYWSKINGSVDTDATAGPTQLGPGIAERMKDNNLGGSGFVGLNRNSVVLSTTTQYTVSIWAKADDLNWIRILPTSWGALDLGAYYDLTNVVVGATTGTDNDSEAIEDWGYGWCRCSLTFTTTGDGTGNFNFRLADDDNDDTVALDSTSTAFFFGAQLEEGPVATTYIPTTSAAVTSPATTATGTIIGTGAFLSGLTDMAGDISVSRVVSTDTPIKGFARKSTSSPRFKTFDLAGNTVDDVNGLSVNVRLILNE